VIEPRAIGWQLPVTLGLLVIVDQVVALGALGVAPRGAAPLSARILAGLLTVAILSAVLLLGRWTWLRGAFSRRHPSIGVLSVVLAVQVGLTGSRRALIAQELLERETGLAAGEFVFLSATTLIVLLVLGALRRHHDLMVDLTAAGMRLSAAHAASTAGVIQERSRLAEQVRELVAQRLGPTSMRAALFTPQRLEEVANDVLRPLAHQLAATPAEILLPARPGRRTRLRTALKALRPAPVLRPGLLAATMAILVFRFSITPPPAELLDPASTPGPGGPDLVITVEWASLIESFALHAATILVVLWGTRRLARWLARREQHAQALGSARAPSSLARAWGVTGLALVGLGLVSLTLLRIVFGRPGFTGLPPVTVGVVIGFTAPLLLITIVLSVLPAVEDALTELRAQLARANEELANAVARANALLEHERRLFARHLHASVQASVNAASLAIERATVDGTVDPEVIARAGAAIDGAVERLREQPSTSEHGGAEGVEDLDARLTAIGVTWEGIAEVDIDLDEVTRAVLADDAIARATLCDLVAEACANAVIHGDAARIAVTVQAHGSSSESNGSLTLTVHDDGSAAKPQRQGGLGSRILTESCTHWELEHGADGTTLTATLPVR
jgi:signal transduction histidine kinase